MRRWLRSAHGLSVLLVLALLTGCGGASGSKGGGTGEDKLTRENLDRVKEGMTEAQAVDLLGPPMETEDRETFPFGAVRVLQWKDGNRPFTVLVKDGKVQAAGAGEWRERPQDPATLRGHTDGVSSVALTADGKLLASGGHQVIQNQYTGVVRLWDIGTRKEIATLRGHAEPVRSLAFSPDGTLLASGGGDKTVKLWDMAGRKERSTLAGHSGDVAAVAFSPEGRLLAAGSGPGTNQGRPLPGEVRLWDVATGQEVAVLDGHQGRVLSLAFARDGKTLFSGSDDRTIKVWDVATRAERASLRGHASPVWGLAVTTDGKTLASGSGVAAPGQRYAGEWKLWDTGTGKQRLSVRGHDLGISSLAFTPDGRTLATGSADRTIKLWDAATGREIVTLKGHGDLVFCVRISRDGRLLASASYDRTVKLWNLARLLDEKPGADGQRPAPGVTGHQGACLPPFPGVGFGVPLARTDLPSPSLGG